MAGTWLPPLTKLTKRFQLGWLCVVITAVDNPNPKFCLALPTSARRQFRAGMVTSACDWSCNHRVVPTEEPQKVFSPVRFCWPPRESLSYSGTLELARGSATVRLACLPPPACSSPDYLGWSRRTPAHPAVPTSASPPPRSSLQRKA